MDPRKTPRQMVKFKPIKLLSMGDDFISECKDVKIVHAFVTYCNLREFPFWPGSLEPKMSEEHVE